MVAQEMWKTYLIIGDQLTKNAEKLKNPRGESGGNSNNMF